MVMHMRIKSLFIITIFLLLVISTVKAPYIKAQPSLGNEVLQNMKAIKLSNIERNVKVLSKFKSRVVGYPGYYLAKNYIANYLRSLGYNVSFHKFKTVSPVEKECYIELENGTKLLAHALWPNGMIQPSNTPKEGYIGRLIYVGKGDLKDFNGLKVKGSIVLMDYDSGSNWINAAKLGAKAVIFIESNNFDRYEALSKFSMTPIKFTRVFVNSSVGQVLKKIALKNETVKVVSRITLDNVIGYNIIAFLDGTEHKDEVIAVSARYDSWSVVPALSPAASEAISMASLLEIARIFSLHRPKRTLMIVAFSGHWNALVGSRRFVEDVLFKPQFLNGTRKIYAFIGLDIGSETPRISTLYAGYGIRFIASDRVSGRLSPFENKFTTNSYLLSKTSTGIRPIDFLNSITGHNYTVYEYVRWDIVSQDWWGDQHYPYMLDTEPLTLVNMFAFSIKTSEQHDYWWGNPQDDYSLINFKNVYIQTLTIIAHITGLLNDDTFNVKWEIGKPTKFTTLYGYPAGLTILTGEVVKLNLTSGWYSPVPHALVRIYPEGPIGTAAWPFSYLVLYADNKGFFNVSIGPIYSTPNWLFDAWIINSNTSEIVAAPDQGPLYGKQVTKPFSSPVTGYDHVLIPLFNCIPVTLYDVYDPSYFRTPWTLDPRMPFSLWLQEDYKASVFNFETGAVPYFYGEVYIPWEPVAMFFVQPNSTVSFAFYFGSAGRPSILLINSSTLYKEGKGIVASRPLVFNLTMLQYTKDFVNIISNRYLRLKKFDIRSPSLDEELSDAKILLTKSEKLIKERDYSDAYKYLMQALAYASGAYKRELMPTYADAGFTAVLLFIISIPAIVIMERLFFHGEGMMKFIYATIIGIIVFAGFFYVHPAFSIMSNTSLGLIGSLLTLLFGIAFTVLIMETGWVVEVTSERILGRHRVRRREVNVFQVSVPISLEFMRRRKIRSALTMITIISVVIALASLTSSSYYTSVRYFAYGKSKLTYNEPQMLIKIGYGVPPYSILQDTTVRYVKGIVGKNGIVMPRAWFYPVYSNRLGHSFTLRSERGKIKPVAILGLSYPEVLRLLRKTHAQYIGLSYKDIKELWGSGSNFIILTSSQAKFLNVTIGSRVSALGMNFVVLSIVPSVALNNMIDIDNLAPTPADPSGNQILAIQISGQPTMNPPPLGWDFVIIVPYKLTVKLGGYVGSIYVLFNCSQTVASNIVQRLTFQSSLTPYFTTNLKSKEIVQAYATKTYLLLGMQMLPPLVIIAVLNIMMALLGNVKERLRDINVLAALGLSPRGATIMFITDTLAFALPSSIIGYVAGFIMNRLFISWGLLPSTFVANAASLFVGISLLVVILSCVIAAAYPSIVSARLITPSLERKWKPPTRPRGDLWEIPLPAVFSSTREAKGFLLFLKEYYEGEGKEKAIFIIRRLILDLNKMIIQLEVSLAPFELNLNQLVTLSITYDQVRHHIFMTLLLKRVAGTRDRWITSNYNFIDDLRKQILMWRTLSLKEQEHYMSQVPK